MGHRTINAFRGLALFLPVLAISVTGCYYDVEELLYPVDSNGTGCDTVDVSYAADVLPVLQSQCYVCHAGNVALGGVDLEGYDNLMIYVSNGQFLGSINWENGYPEMPQGAPQLDDCTLSKMNAWVHEGAFNN